MESKHLDGANEFMPRVTFRSIRDVKRFMLTLVDELTTMQRAGANMVRMGIPTNSGAMDNARRDTRETATLLESVYLEFKRLHPTQCVDPECVLGDSEIDEAITGIRELVAEIDKSQAEADAMGPATEEQETAPLLGLLGQLGQALGIPSEELTDAPPVRDARFGESGTGLYL